MSKKMRECPECLSWETERVNVSFLDDEIQVTRICHACPTLYGVIYGEPYKREIRTEEGANNGEVRSDDGLSTDGGQTVLQALQALEKECEIDETCRETAVTYTSDGVPACEYHSGEWLTSDE